MRGWYPVRGTTGPESPRDRAETSRSRDMLQRKRQDTNSLAGRCAADFAAQIRRRGIAYTSPGIVRLGRPELDGVSATVRSPSGASYLVDVDWTEVVDLGLLIVSCTCPYAARALCKHIWAVILMIDEKGIASRVPGNERIDVVLEDEMEEELEKRTPLSSPDPRPAASTPPARAARPPSWEDQLGDLARRSGTYGGSPFPRPGRGIARPAEIWFAIHPGHSTRHRDLVLQFLQREARKSGGLGVLKPLRVSEPTVRGWEPSPERDALDRLLGLDPERGTSYDPRFGTWPCGSALIRPPLVRETLRLLSSIDRLCVFQPEKKGEDPVPLSFDDGEAWRFELVAAAGEPDDRSRKEWTVEGMLVRGDERVPVTEPEIFLPPCLFVREGRVALLQVDDTESRWAEWFRAGHRLQVPPQMVPAFLERIHRIPSVPFLHLPDDSEWTQTSGEPRPRMVIDRPMRSGPRRFPPADFDAEIKFDYAVGGSGFAEIG
ncbi:MAG: hypothetical protein GF346_09675, partial [Candidatus Eisenbacteria bacterium]|nr:hypothetical protein [Candidatus Latescibacterota bacterium]MBD3302702.1 hypothetical protein [Candidatus Eisenbacteria bacterium]